MNNDLIKPTKLVRTRRKSIALIINNRGELIVRVPVRVSEKDIYEFIIKKANWIIEKRTKIKNNPYITITPKSNEKIPILDTIYDIELYNLSRAKIVENKLFVPNENSKEKLINFLKKYARKYLNERVAELAKKFCFNYKNISISSAHTRWGSCNYYNSLTFTYKLILCPKFVVDYIIIHELSHTIEKNHSKKFWSLVKKCLPNYKDCEKWLKDNRSIIDLI